SVEAGLGAGWRALVESADLAALDAAWRDAVTHRLPVDVDVRLALPSGSRRCVRVLSAPVSRDDAVVGHAGVLVDVTLSQERLAELELRESRLRLLEARGQALLEALPDLVFQLDAEGTFVDFQASPAAAGAMLVPPERFLGRALEDIVPVGVAGQAREALSQARQSGEARRLEYELDVGSPGLRAFEARLSPMRSGGFLALVRDVTDLKRAQRELLDARERAALASGSRSQFLANVSHEIRTPLNGVLGVTQLLRTLTLPGEVLDYLQVLEGAGEALRALVDDVLDLSKLEARQLALESAPFDLSALVAQVTRELLPEAQRKRLELGVDVAEGARGQVVGDAARVRQMLTSVVTAALRYAEVGPVQLRAQRGGGADVVVSVGWTGARLSSGVQQALFEPFAQPGAQRRGAGLGLAIARALARLMGGELALDVVAGSVNVFELRLPLAPAAGAGAGRPAASTRRLKVLLAEDDDVSARLAQSMLEWLGHHVERVGDGLSAVARSAQTPFDVVFMDVDLPRLDGLEATRRIRQREGEGQARLAIVALTANAVKADERACLSAGMDAYLSKPVTVQALSDVVAWLSA
ncbi:MAG: response regulator, partial [Myxococcaceae bacterium]|nr:response regulator [Myxococcaceae bacterium]